MRAREGDKHDCDAMFVLVERLYDVWVGGKVTTTTTKQEQILNESSRL